MKEVRRSMIGASLPQSIAIVTASPPGENGVGQNYIRDLVTAISDQCVHVYALLKDANHWQPEDRTGIASFEILAQKYEHAKGLGPGYLGELSSQIAFHVVTMTYAKRLAKRLATSFKQRAIDTVLVVLESPLLMLIGAQLARLGDHRIRLLVWDHPDHVAAYFGHRGAAAKRLRGACTRACLGAEGALTVGQSLGTHLTILNPSLPVHLFRSPVELSADTSVRSQSPNRMQFVIGFAGSTTAPDELELLQRSLDILEWQVHGRKIILRLFGKRFTLASSSPRNVEYRGFLPSRKDVIAALAECDVCFVPQPFSAARRLMAEFSFPTKLSTCLASGAPVLALTPAYGSLANFLPDVRRDTGPESAIGFTLTEPSAAVLSELIRSLALDNDFHDGAADRARQTALRYFRRDEGARHIRQVLGLPSHSTEMQPSNLRPSLASAASH